MILMVAKKQRKNAPVEQDPVPYGTAVLMVEHVCVKCDASQLVPIAIGDDGIYYPDGLYCCGDCQSDLRIPEDVLKKLAFWNKKE
jgi:hypothetical protein